MESKGEGEREMTREEEDSMKRSKKKVKTNNDPEVYGDEMNVEMESVDCEELCCHDLEMKPKEVVADMKIEEARNEKVKQLSYRDTVVNGNGATTIPIDDVESDFSFSDGEEEDPMREEVISRKESVHDRVVERKAEIGEESFGPWMFAPKKGNERYVKQGNERRGGGFAAGRKGGNKEAISGKDNFMKGSRFDILNNENVMEMDEDVVVEERRVDKNDGKENDQAFWKEGSNNDPNTVVRKKTSKEPLGDMRNSNNGVVVDRVSVRGRKKKDDMSQNAQEGKDRGMAVWKHQMSADVSHDFEQGVSFQSLWSDEGAGRRAFARLLKDLCRDNKVDILFICEPRISGTRADDVIRRSGWRNVHKVDAEGFSCGLWLCWSDVINIQVLESTDQCIHLRVDIFSQGKSFLLSTVYASPNHEKREGLWRFLKGKADSIAEAWVVLGDFNAYLNGNEKRGGVEPNRRSMRCFRECVEYRNLLDLGFEGPAFTWKWGEVEERLDRCVCNMLWQERLMENKDELWARVLRTKYHCGSDLVPVISKRQVQSNSWKGVCKVWKEIDKGLTWSVGNGRKIRFWSDFWIPKYGALAKWACGDTEILDEDQKLIDFVDENGCWKEDSIRRYLPGTICRDVLVLSS
ncbi:RNA-directed DNA polymerase [Senna tora]|uniref:RNA-directed DNA polymerase n=1 Tax=Senna tora TaxID=362788 RepID=A0A834X6Y0_9FABA|nr:RNA-directed DNA polymerase [Senna tora]